MPRKTAKTILNYKIETVDSSLLEVLREDYQKPLNEKRVAQIVAAFDENTRRQSITDLKMLLLCLSMSSNSGTILLRSKKWGWNALTSIPLIIGGLLWLRKKLFRSTVK